MNNSKDTTVRFKLYFEDDTTANYDISGVSPDEDNLARIVPIIKTRVRAFNANPTEYSNLMVSKAGAPWIAITAVTITTTERNYIF